MRLGISEGVFPGAVLLVSQAGRIVFHKAYGFANVFNKRPMKRKTFFDLASLTKPLATTLALMELVRQKCLALDQKLATLLPVFADTDKGSITIEQLLAHHGGLPDYRPYYLDICHRPPVERRTYLIERLVQEPLVHPVGQQALYSDLGFMVLQEAVEAACRKPMNFFVREQIYRPLEIDTLFFCGADKPKAPKRFAATEMCSWRGMLLEGVVHDENAYAVGGVAGHSGLFGNAAGVHVLLDALYATYVNKREGVPFDRDLLRRFFKRFQDSDRALGFDTPAIENSSTGRYLSRNTVGHLGFTGTSFWLDLDSGITVVLLTNRIHPTRDNTAIKMFRPAIHDAVWSALN